MLMQCKSCKAEARTYDEMGDNFSIITRCAKCCSIWVEDDVVADSVFMASDVPQTGKLVIVAANTQVAKITSPSGVLDAISARLLDVRTRRDAIAKTLDSIVQEDHILAEEQGMLVRMLEAARPLKPTSVSIEVN